MMYGTKTHATRHRLGALVLALCLALSLLPAPGGTARADFSDAAMDKLINWGVVGGYPDGNTHPERSLSRAEFVSMVNRAYGYNKTGPTPFIDVPASAWYADDVGIAYNAKYFGGVSPRMAAPDESLTREQAMVLLARNMRIEPVPGEVTEFADGRDFQEWSRGYARAAAQSGVISGYSNGTFKPQNEITRGEMAVMLQRALGTLINKPGTHTLSDVYGNVTLSSPNAMLKDSTIHGDLYITGGLDLGDITLENVRVMGEIIVAGGGESHSGEESIVLRNVEADTLRVDSIADQFVSLAAEGNTVIPETLLRSNSYVQDRTRPGEGFLNITLDSPDVPSDFTLSGNLETVLNKTPGSTLNVAVGTAKKITVDEYARNSTLNLDINSTATELNLDVATNVRGVGDIDKLNVNAPGSTVEMLPDTITIRPGLTANIAGQEMNAQQAQESSADPRLLAGYPKVRNVAPKSATAVFSANKAGKVYWAISTTTDGSIPEDELIIPTDKNTRIALNGTTEITESNKEFTAALEKLTPDTNYYISTVMVDARGRHSPVKVAAFTTPDDTEPKFAKEYPKIIQNSFRLEPKTIDGAPAKVPNFFAQAGVMASKSCQLYYVLYPAGSVEPTPQQFRTGNLDKPIRGYRGVEDISKNALWTKDFTGLEELTTYDLYFWLTDADGAHSSKVEKLTFTTKDGTPPIFQHETPALAGNPPATSIPTNVNLNETCTVYWAVVKHGTDFINAKAVTALADTPLQTVLDNLKAATLQAANGAFTDAAKAADKELNALKAKIESGTGSLKNGSSRAQKDANAAVNINGLTAETMYDVYFVAKDGANNYSDVKVIEGVRTLDVSPPTVDQTFTKPGNTGLPYPNPYANTDIILTFSEDIQLYSTSEQKGTAELAGKPLSTLADDPALLDLFLRNCITFYNDSGSDPTVPLTPRSQLGPDDPWAIDFRKATVTTDPDTGAVMVTLPTTLDDATGTPIGALNLQSDSVYHFTFDNIMDLATTPNRMRGMPYSLPSFRTIAAQVTLRELNVPTLADGTVIDRAFSLKPDSTNVAGDMDWDILLWSDSSVSFVIYEMTQNENGTFSGTPVRHESDPADDAHAAQTIVNNNELRPDGSKPYIALSLFRDFYGLNFNPSITGNGNKLSDAQEAITDAPDSGKMIEGQLKYYGIRFTEVNNGGPERNAWDATVNLRVSVVSGTSANLGNLASNITEETLQEYRDDWGVSEIHTPNPFPLRKQFSNKVAPDFYTGYPQFRDVTDTTAIMRVMLDRPGKIFYAVAPVSVTPVPAISDSLYDPSTGTTLAPGARLADGTTLPSSVSIDTRLAETLAAAGIPSTASAFIGKIPGSGDAGAELSIPKPSVIYSPSFGNERIKSGNYELGTSSADIPLRDLEPNTLYFVYFVMQGTGQVYSTEVLLYQFTTKDVYRPQLVTQTSPNPIVHVTSKNMNAVADYAVFQMRGLPEVLEQPFTAAIDTDKYVCTETVTGGKYSYTVTDTEGKFLGAFGPSDAPYTVYDAMCNQNIEVGGSLYDEFARADHKDAVRKYITGQTFIRSRVGSSANKTLNEGVYDEVDCRQYDILPGQEYLFVASARSKSASESIGADSYGFAAAQPIYIIDQDPPLVSNISGSVTVDCRGTEPKIVGTIFLMFDKDLYYFIEDTQKALPFTKDAADSSTTEKNIKYFQNIAGTGPADRSNMRPIDILNSRQVEIQVGTFSIDSHSGGIDLDSITAYDRSGDRFIATSYLVSAFSSPNTEDPLEFSLRFEPGEGVVYLDMKTGSWYAPITAALQTDVITPDPTSIRLNTSSLELAVGDTRQVTATVTPESAACTIYWEIADASVATIDTTGATVNVQALKEGSTTFYAYTTKRDGTVIRTTDCSISVTSGGVKILKPGESGNEQPVPVINLQRGEELQLNLSLTPSTAYVISSTWLSFNTGVVTVTTPMEGSEEPGGKLKAIAAGTTTVKATVTTSVGTFEASRTIAVRDPASP